MRDSPEWLRVLSVFRLVLGFVGSGAAGERAVRGVVARHVTRAVAAGRRTLQLLRLVLDARTIGSGTPGQAGWWGEDRLGQVKIFLTKTVCNRLHMMGGWVEHEWAGMTAQGWLKLSNYCMTGC